MRITIVPAFKEHDGEVAKELLTRKKTGIKSRLTDFSRAAT